METSKQQKALVLLRVLWKSDLRLSCSDTAQIGAGKLPVLCGLLGHHYGWWLLSNTGGNPAFRLYVLQHSSKRETCDNQEKAHSVCAFARRLGEWPKPSLLCRVGSSFPVFLGYHSGGTSAGDLAFLLPTPLNYSKLLDSLVF